MGRHGGGKIGMERDGERVERERERGGWIEQGERDMWNDMEGEMERDSERCKEIERGGKGEREEAERAGERNKDIEMRRVRRWS